MAARTGLTYDVVYLAPRRFGVVVNRASTPGIAEQPKRRDERFTEQDFYAFAGKSHKRKKH